MVEKGCEGFAGGKKIFIFPPIKLFLITYATNL